MTSFSDEDLCRHAGSMRALARDLLADDALADDAVQQAYVTALTRPPATRVAVASWLAQAASRTFAAIPQELCWHIQAQASLHQLVWKQPATRLASWLKQARRTDARMHRQLSQQGLSEHQSADSSLRAIS